MILVLLFGSLLAHYFNENLCNDMLCNVLANGQKRLKTKQITTREK